MNFVLKPSLEHMALVQIGILFWNQNDIRALISKLNYRDLHPFVWEKIEEKVTMKVPQLLLPQLLKEKVLCVIKPIGIQIHKWMKYHQKYGLRRQSKSRLYLHLSAEFFWTPQGTVDRKRTAEALVRNENLILSRRYNLAYDYCLEDDIIRLWKRLPENLKNYNWCKFRVMRFWPEKLRRGGAVHISYKSAFCSSVRDSNSVAAKYFLQKLTPQEREESLKVLLNYIDDADVLCFLLPELEEEEQMFFFKSKPDRVLEYFLQWPLQSYFIGVANRMWDFLSKKDYDKILKGIIYKVKDGHKDYDYQNLFREFWQKSPSALKDSLIEGINFLSSLLISFQDKENIRFIFKDYSLTAKAKFINRRDICFSLARFLRDNKWDFLEFFIRECLPSKNELLKFKERFEMLSQFFFKELFETKKQEWDQLFHMMTHL